MPYRSTEKTRQKKDAKRTAMMQAAVQIFAQKGYQAATVRDIVKAAGVSIGTFYFYFPDKETLFIHLYEETADFLLKAMLQGVRTTGDMRHKLIAGVEAYINIGLFEPAVVQLLLVGGVGALPALAARRSQFRESLVRGWQRPLDEALAAGEIVAQDTRYTAEAIVGAVDEVVLNILAAEDMEIAAEASLDGLITFLLRGIGWQGELKG
ncbi:MAG TPA: TetR/AcrR family transcriptional regulator [Anaerolineae bacterium]|nr:TetR/AcrR family transcriptional regulator [Anaerolineae bacterium]